MDTLKAEIATKRRALTEDPLLASRPTKYMRRGEIEKMKEEQERKAREEKEQAERTAREAAQEKKAALTLANLKYVTSSDLVLESNISLCVSCSGIPVRDAESPKPESSFSVSNEETIRRLRVKGQPIRLFGESDKDRRLRLRALELIEEKGHDRQGGQNDFKKALEDVENVERELKGKTKGKKKERQIRSPWAYWTWTCSKRTQIGYTLSSITP
ncbi:mRNA splicing protein [Salix suchowensis]|nr:mRNA splicing protein [Salix suchowensis]